MQTIVPDHAAELKRLAGLGKDRPLRVLFVSHTSSLIGGADLCLHELLSRLDRHRIVPHVVLPMTWRTDGFPGALAALGVPYTPRALVHWIDFGWRSEEGRLKLAWSFICGLRERVWSLATLIEREKIDIVYSNTVTVLEGALAARITNRPHIWHIHEAVQGNSALRPFLPFFLIRSIVSSLSSRIVFPSAFLAHAIYGYGKTSKKAVVVHNGVDFCQFAADPFARGWISKLANIPDTAPRVAIVGSLHPGKRVGDFISAAVQPSLRRHGAYFLIVGTGSPEETQELHDLTATLGVDACVRFLGWQSDIARVLAGIDLLVVASEQETFGRSIVEAMACGTPVVSTRCGGPEELIEDGQTGLLVPVGSPKKLAGAMDKLLSNPDFTARLSATARERVMSNFSIASYISGIEEVMTGAALS